MTKELLFQLKGKEYRQWKLGKVTWEKYREVPLCREGARKANAKLERNPARESKKVTERCCTCWLIRKRRSNKVYAL